MRLSILYLVFFGLLFAQCRSENVQTNTISAVTQNVIPTPEPDPIPSYIDLAFVMGKFSIQEHNMFVRIESKYAENGNRYMHKEAYESFKKMHAAAKADGVHLIIRSAARNFDYQKRIWERKWKGNTLLEGKYNAQSKFADPKERALAILKYSSMPSTSRHHWGTDIDINAFENSHFENGEGLKVYKWLVANALNYGFCQPYTKKDANRPSGYEEEKWHWSYLPVANQCMQIAEKEFKNELVQGFLGSNQATVIDVYTHYIRGIHKSCLD